MSKKNGNGNGNKPAKVETPGGALANLMSEDERKKLLGDQIGGFEKPSFPLLKIPTGGSKAFDLPNADPVKELHSIIVHHRPARGYWRKSLDEGGDSSMPDCASSDGIHGKALADDFDCPSETGLCRDCPMNQFGTAKNKDGSKGRGKACTTKHFLYIIDKDAEELIPTLFRIPVTSLKNLQQYFTALSKNNLLSLEVDTVFSLVEDKNADGTKYSKLVVERGDRLPDEVIVKAFGIRNNYLHAMDEQLLTKEESHSEEVEDTEESF